MKLGIVIRCEAHVSSQNLTKPCFFSLSSVTVSNTVKRKIKRISEFDEQTKSYTMAAYLIAQIGKNETNDAYERITGAELLELAWSVIEEMQYRGGGMVVFLEANDEERLLAFYQNNKFRQFDTRLTASHAENQHELIQLF